MSQVIQDIDSFFQSPYSLHKLKQLFRADEAFNISYDNLQQTNFKQLKLITNYKLMDEYSFATTLTVSISRLTIRSILMHNMKNVVIQSSEMRRNMYRAQIRSNNVEIFRVLANSLGQISFNYQSILTSEVEWRFHGNISRVKHYIEKIYKQTMEMFKQKLNPTLIIIEENRQKYIATNTNTSEKLDINKNFCKLASLAPLTKNCVKKISNFKLNVSEDNKFTVPMLYDFNICYQNSEMEVQKNKFFLYNFYCKQNCLKNTQDVFINFTLSKIKSLIQAVLKPLPMKNYRGIDKQQILTNIKIQNFKSIKWNEFYRGGFGSLFRGEISYYMCDKSNNKGVLQRKPSRMIIVRKTAQKKECTKTLIEKQIIMLIKDKRSRFLPRYYTSEQFEHTNQVLMEYYQLKSLDQWMHSFGKFISLFTKLQIIISICHGLQFLHENRIVHRDLKLANILIDQRMIIKLMDFGESYHPEVQKKLREQNIDMNPGFTIPYSPPEYFLLKKQLITNTSYDIFALGLMIYEIIFGTQIFGKVSDQKLKQLFFLEAKSLTVNQQAAVKYHSLIKSRILIAPELQGSYGPMQIITPIFNIIQKCIDPAPQNRPNLQWILVILKQTSNSLLQFYSQ